MIGLVTCVHARVRRMNIGWVLVRILHCCQIHYIQCDSQNLTQGQRFGCEKNPWTFVCQCGCDSEEYEDGVGAGANSTLLSDTL